MSRLPTLLAALSEPTRLGAVRLLWDGQERCVCDLMDRLGATQSRMSRHIPALKNVGLLLDRHDAQWVRYRRKPQLAPAIANVAPPAARDTRNTETGRLIRNAGARPKQGLQEMTQPRSPLTPTAVLRQPKVSC